MIGHRKEVWYNLGFVSFGFLFGCLCLWWSWQIINVPIGENRSVSAITCTVQAKTIHKVTCLVGQHRLEKSLPSLTVAFTDPCSSEVHTTTTSNATLYDDKCVSAFLSDSRAEAYLTKYEVGQDTTCYRFNRCPSVVKLESSAPSFWYLLWPFIQVASLLFASFGSFTFARRAFQGAYQRGF